jgi:hypothetical protein
LLKLRNKIKFLCFILLFWPAGSDAAVYSVQHGNVFVTGAEPDSLIIDFILETVVETRPAFDQFFADSIRSDIVFKLAASEEEYARIVDGYLPDWSGAASFLQSNRVILKPQRVFNPLAFREVILHELAHLYLGNLDPGHRLPLWIQEGVAQIMSGKTLVWTDGITLGNALVGNDVVSLEQIDQVLRFGEVRARIAYLQSMVATQYLMSQLTQSEFQQFLYDYGSAVLPDSALYYRYFGYDFYEFERLWYADLKKNYHWMFLLQMENILWVLLVLLVFIIFIIKKIRNRRVIENWRRDETDPYEGG